MLPVESICQCDDALQPRLEREHFAQVNVRVESVLNYSREGLVKLRRTMEVISQNEDKGQGFECLLLDPTHLFWSLNGILGQYGHMQGCRERVDLHHWEFYIKM